MTKFCLFATGVAMMIAGTVLNAHADDVVVRHKTNEGKIERLVVDHTQLPEVNKALRESKPLDRFMVSEKDLKSSMIKSPMRDPAGGGDEEEPEGFAVRFAVEEEEAPEGWIYQPWKVYVCKGDGEYGRAYYNYSYYPDEEMIAQGYAWGCYVPEGEYTIILCSSIYSFNENEEYPDYITALYVVKENVKIEGDTTITFRQSEAKNCITASCLFPDGSEAPGDPYIYDENNEWIGQRDDFYIQASRSFVNINGDYSLNLGNFEHLLDYVFVNDLSSNWVYVINMTMVDENGAYANCVIHPGPITSSMNIQNDPTEYKLTYAKFNAALPKVNPNTKGFGIGTKLAWKGADWYLGAEGMIFDRLGITDEIPLYINAPASTLLISPKSFDLITIPIVATDKIKVMAEDWDGNPILDETGEQIYYYTYPAITGAGIYHYSDDEFMCVDSYGYDIDEYPDESFLLPFDKVFSFEKTPTTEFFTNAPVLSLFADSFIREDYSRFDILHTFYYPCLSSYSLPYSFTAKYNGTVVAENETADTFNWEEWSLENYKEPGVFDVEFSAAWKTEDPKAIVGNTIHVDTRNEDYFVPQVVRWQLRNQNGSIGSVATTDSKIYLMCHEDLDLDFELTISSPEAKDYDCKIEMIRDEKFYDWGTWLIRRVYEVSLEDFPGTVGEKYSLEFNLSDASGNTSKQSIGNAFEWAGTNGINSTGANNDIYFADGTLHAPANAEVFTIDGRRADRNTLTSGLYIVRTGNNTAKVLVP